MPLYDFICDVCGEKQNDRYFSPSDIQNVFCNGCGNLMTKLFPMNTQAIVFKPQMIDDGVFVRNSMELKDHIKRYNDSHQAQKTGKIAVFEKLSKREY
jgi:predicted nucleic acid-binding Zn ribbon protein